MTREPERQLPYDVDVEQALLGAVLLDENAYWRVADRLCDHHFYDPLHQRMYAAIAKVCSAGGYATPLTLAAAMAEDEGLIQVGGRAYLVSLAKAAPAMPNLTGYAKIIARLAQRRSMVQIAQDVLEQAYNSTPDDDPAEIADQASQDLYDATHGLDPGEGLVSIVDLADRALKEAEAAFNRPEDVCLSSGLKSVDEALGMVYRGDLLVVGAATSMGKGLALDTLIPTPSGWTTMRAINVGDMILDASGAPTRVSATSDVHHRPCYLFKFSDGSELVADDEHRWFTTTADERAGELKRSHRYRASERARKAARRGPSTRPWLSARNAKAAAAIRAGQYPDRKLGAVRTTLEIAASLIASKGGTDRFNHHITNAGPLELPQATLPLPPYVLGAWLGDGSSAAAEITAGPQDYAHFIDQIQAEGFTADAARRKPRLWSIRIRPTGEVRRTISSVFKALGVWRNKHIPAQYLRASFDQRLALLQGLMDTDGHADKNGNLEFTTCTQALADGMTELLHSLGAQFRPRWYDAKVYGRVVNRKCRITFCLPFPAFRLSRKLAVQKTTLNRKSLARSIVAVDPIETVPTKCIAVESADRMFLAGRQMIPTHNTSLVQKMLITTALAGHAAAMYSLEMRGESVALRYLAQIAKVPSDRIRQGAITEKELELLNMAPQQLAGVRDRLRIDSSPNLSVAQIRARAQAFKRKHPELAMIVIDHLQYIAPADPRASTDEQTRQITRDLCAVAKDLNVAVVLISHLTKENEKRHSKRPIMADLYGSGGIAQNADSVWFLYRASYYLERESPDAKSGKEFEDWARSCDQSKGKAEIYSTKVRMGRPNQVTVGFNEVFTRFFDLESDNPMSEQDTLALTGRMQ